MPTPFQHIAYAKTVLEDPLLPQEIREALVGAESAYLQGVTAVDVQAITGQKRFATHFYRLSEPNVGRAAEMLLRAYPELRDPAVLSPEHRAFLSGYLVHLAWDELWAWEVFIPFYTESRVWRDRLSRSVHHNALRVLLDRQALAVLVTYGDVAQVFVQAQPRDWLPFVPDAALAQWRDWIAAQLRYPEQVQTVNVFAERMGVSAEHLERVVEAIALGTYQPPIEGLHTAVERFEQRACADSINALLWYWKLQEQIGWQWEMAQLTEGANPAG